MRRRHTRNPRRWRGEGVLREWARSVRVGGLSEDAELEEVVEECATAEVQLRHVMFLEAVNQEGRHYLLAFKHVGRGE
jgi:hypothetical protein